MPERDGSRPFLQHVWLRNYKSIGDCSVELGPLALLVGPNGSGKSNFLDALRFVAESLQGTLDQALRERGGIREVRRRATGQNTRIGIGLGLSLPSGRAALYEVDLGAKPRQGFVVHEERCQLFSPSGNFVWPHARKEADTSVLIDFARHAGEPRTFTYYHVRDGVVQADKAIASPPPASTDRLYLTVASGFPDFREVYDALTGMGFYNINPQRIRDLQDPDPGDLLARDGRNVASVLAKIQRTDPQVRERIEEYLRAIVPGLRGVERQSLGHKETLEFKQAGKNGSRAWTFSAQNMSDGTLRAMGILVALFQAVSRAKDRPIPLVGIEEPEVALHPAASGVLMDALREASHSTQVLVTTHSPELLDTPDLSPDSLLVVTADEGHTVIAPADDASVSAIRDRLCTAGELLKLDQLRPRPVGVATGTEVNAPYDTAPDLPNEP